MLGYSSIFPFKQQRLNSPAVADFKCRHPQYEISTLVFLELLCFMTSFLFFCRSHFARCIAQISRWLLFRKSWTYVSEWVSEWDFYKPLPAVQWIALAIAAWATVSFPSVKNSPGREEIQAKETRGESCPVTWSIVGVRSHPLPNNGNLEAILHELGPRIIGDCHHLVKCIEYSLLLCIWRSHHASWLPAKAFVNSAAEWQAQWKLIYFVSDDLISSKHFAGMCLLSALHRIYIHCTCHSAALLTVASMILIPSLQAFS